jgi:drug/metabolite transporter (DMT)-like permease
MPVVDHGPQCFAAEYAQHMNASGLMVAVAAMLASTLFFVGGKMIMARFQIPWVAYWRWSLGAASLAGLVAWVVIGCPAPIGWEWCLGAGMVGALAHVLANTALSLGEASLLVPVSGAKPVILLLLNPIATGAAVPPALRWACLLATVGVVVASLSPRREHRHARRPSLALFLMMGATACMALSDVIGNVGLAHLREAGTGSRAGAIAIWNMGLGVLPVLSMAIPRWRISAGAAYASAGNGLVFALYIVLLAAAFQLMSDPAQAVPLVNVVISLRGVCAVIVVMAVDRWLRMGLEPVPPWVHGLRLAGAVILVGAVALAF